MNIYMEICKEKQHQKLVALYNTWSFFMAKILHTFRLRFSLEESLKHFLCLANSVDDKVDVLAIAGNSCWLTNFPRVLPTARVVLLRW